MSNYKPSGADERTPLVNGGASSSGHEVVERSSRSKARVFLFDSSHTPGLDNESLAIRSLVYSWHVAKVTILSGMFTSRPPPAGLTDTDRLCELPTSHGAHWHHRWSAGLEPSCRLYHQLLRHHPSRRRSLVCDRRNLLEAGRDHGWTPQCHLWKCR